MGYCHSVGRKLHPGVVTIRDEQCVLDLVALIYDAAGDPALWPVFLDRFADAVQGTTTSLIFYDATRQAGGLTASARSDPIDQRKYNEYYVGVDCWGIHGGHLLAPGKVLAGQQLCPDRVLEQSEFYADFLRPMKAFHQVCGIIAVNASSTSLIASVRSKTNGPFKYEDTRLLNILMPHLQRALVLHQRIEALHATNASAIEALDRLPHGLVLVSAAMEVVFLNRSAKMIVDQNDGLTVNRRYLRARSSDDTRRLHELLQKSISTSLGRGMHAGGATTIARPSHRRPFHVLVTPVHLRTMLPTALTPAAVAFIADPELKFETEVQTLVQLFDLSRAEARLAAALSKGYNLTETSQLLGISLSTVRTQLGKLFEKTGTTRQAALIRTILMSPASLISS